MTKAETGRRGMREPELSPMQERNRTRTGDEHIIELFFRRVEEAIPRTQEKYGALCRSVAWRILEDPRDVEECESDVYLHLWNAIPPERPRSLRAYLARIARNLALDRYNYNASARRSTALTDAFEELEPWLPAREEGTESQIDGLHFRQVLNDFLRSLPQESRVFFLRRYWYGETIAEIASECAAGESKIKISLFRTRERLREVLIKERIAI